jgi:CheY-like chemotaxis protein
MVAVLLRDLGLDTVVSPDAESAREVVQRDDVDCVVADVRLPGMNGIEFTEELHASPDTAELPVILISAYGEPRQHSASEFIPKPFDIDTLASAVAGCTERGQRRGRRTES